MTIQLFTVMPTLETLPTCSGFILGPGLLSTEGIQHRKQRKMLNPVFSTKHLRGMVPLFYSVTNQFCPSFRRRTRLRKF